MNEIFSNLEYFRNFEKPLIDLKTIAMKIKTAGLKINIEIFVSPKTFKNILVFK